MNLELVSDIGWWLTLGLVGFVGIILLVKLGVLLTRDLRAELKVKEGLAKIVPFRRRHT